MSQSVIFFSFFLFRGSFAWIADNAREGDGGWARKGGRGLQKKRRTRERERREKGWMEEGRDVSFALNLENHAQPHFPRERPLPAPRRCTRTVFYPFAARFKPRQPFLRPPIYNSPAMRRSRTKDERKIPWWETLTQSCRGISAHANCYGEISVRDAKSSTTLAKLASFPFLFLQQLYVPHRPSFWGINRRFVGEDSPPLREDSFRDINVIRHGIR